MICSVLPWGAFWSAAAASRISRSLSLADSPAAQRLLQRVIEAGMGLLARHVPLANSKKSLHGSALRSRSLRSMPCRVEVCENRSEENKNNGSTQRVDNHALRIMNSSFQEIVKLKWSQPPIGR